MRKCKTCGLEKSIEEFYKTNSGGARWHVWVCKECMKAVRAKNFKRDQASQAAWRARQNPEELRAKVRARYRELHPVPRKRIKPLCEDCKMKRAGKHSIY